MHALTDMPIRFPGLFGDWEFNPDPIAIHIGHGIYWYGVIIAVALLVALLICTKSAKRYGITEDEISDMILLETPFCIIGSRLYYVLFNLDFYRGADGALDFRRIIAIWDGGLAIYGTIIMGALVAFLYARRKKIKFGAIADLAVIGLMAGQVIGRWANFINREAFGVETTLPWRMQVWVSASKSIEVHPTFFYESLWNLIGLLLLVFVVAKARRFDGENTWFYFLWYGVGRSWIEGLRSDSLYLFDWTLFGKPIRVSQLLSFLLAVVALFMLIRLRRRHYVYGDLYVDQREMEAAAAEEAEDGELPAEDAASAEGVPAEAGELPSEEGVSMEEAEPSSEDEDVPAEDAELPLQEQDVPAEVPEPSSEAPETAAEKKEEGKDGDPT